MSYAKAWSDADGTIENIDNILTWKKEDKEKIEAIKEEIRKYYYETREENL